MYTFKFKKYYFFSNFFSEYIQSIDIQHSARDSEMEECESFLDSVLRPQREKIVNEKVSV